MKKHCNRCKRTKDASEYNKNKAASDGLQGYCRECTREIWRANYNDVKYRYSENKAIKMARMASEERMARRHER